MTRPIAPHVRKALAGPLQAKAADPRGNAPSAAHLQRVVAAAQAKTPAVTRAPAAHVQAALAGGPQAKMASAAPPIPRAVIPAGPPSRAIQGFFPGGLSGVVQAARQGGAIQAKLEGSAVRLPAGWGNLQARGGGQPLPEAVRQRMEAVFATDFSDVRIHVGREAPSIGALAFTHGSQIHFAPGQYDPGSAAGLRLLSHELTHVVQQRAGRVSSPHGQGVAIVHDPRLEAEAERMATRCAAQPCVQARPAVPEMNRRQVVQPFGIKTKYYHRSWVRYMLGDEVPDLTEAELDHAEGLGRDFKDIDEIKALILGRRPAAAAIAAAVRVEAKAVPPPVEAKKVVPSADVKLDPRIVDRETGSSGKHHPIRFFRFTAASGEEPTRYDLDDWSNKKTAGTILWPKPKSGDLTEAIRTWDFKRCLARDLIAQDLKFAAGAGRRDLVMLLMSVDESLAERLHDIGSNCPAQLLIKDAKDVTQETISINWQMVLVSARRSVKAALDAKTAVPADHHEVKFVDDAALASDDAGLKKLKDAKFLVKAPRGAALVKKPVRYKPPGAIRESGMTVEEPKKPNFNFGLGHLRYIIFLEWRVLKEMLDSATATG